MLRHLSERDDCIYCPAQFDGDIYTPDGHPAVASQSTIAFIGCGVAVLYHHGAGHGFTRLQTDLLGGNTRDINEGVSRIDRILEKKPVPEPEHPQVPVAYDVEFRQVSFSYENTEQGTRTEALRDVSFVAPQGKITALVGPSGSGKSTVANLIPRFWDVEQGEICIGGVDIRRIATAKLMDMVSFVFQDTFLFYDTLYENIAVGSLMPRKKR